MNKKLQKQMMSITHIDKHVETTRRMQWLYAYNERQQFIMKLRKAYPSKDVLASMTKEERKEVAKQYSKAVVEYDKQYVNGTVFV